MKNLRLADISTFLPLLILLTLFSRDSVAERFFEQPVELLRVESGRVYVWSASSITLNPDFSLEIQTQLTGASIIPLTGILERVAVSDTIPAKILAAVLGDESPTLSVFLDSDKICDSLVVALPRNFRSLWLDTLWVFNSQLNITYQFRYYDKIEEVEIAGRLGTVDLLIAPDPELPAEPMLVDFGPSLEWYFTTEGVKDDLLATAICYCFKGQLAADGDDSISSAILPTHVAQIFPRNTEYAHSLFLQSKEAQSKLGCYFDGYAMYPKLIETLNRRLTSCGGRKLVFEEKPSSKIALEFYVVDSSTTSPIDLAQRLVFSGESNGRRALTLWKDEYLDSCILGKLPANTQCITALSRALAESARIVPLGRSRLAVRKFDHVRSLASEGDFVSLSDFYTITK